MSVTPYPSIVCPDCEPIRAPIPGHYICEYGGPDSGCDEAATHEVVDFVTWRYCCQHAPIPEGTTVERSSRRVWVNPIHVSRRWDEYQAQHFLVIHLRWPTYRARR